MIKNTNELSEKASELQKQPTFFDLSANSQIAQLQLVKNEIETKRYEDINSPDLSVEDVSYNLTDGGLVVFDVTLKDRAGKEFHEFYNEDFSKIDLNSEIVKMKALNLDTSKLEDKVHELNSLSQHPEKRVSLKESEKSSKEFKETASELGLSEDEIIACSTSEYDSSKRQDELNIDFDKMKGIKSQDIDGEERVSTYDRINDVLGEKYKSYKMVVTKDGSPIVFGIDEKGQAAKLDSDKFQIVTDVKKLALMRSDNLTKQVGVVGLLRIVDSGSDKNQNQYIGISNDNGFMNTFYARGESLDSDKLLAKEFDYPSHAAANPSVRKDSLEKMDIRDNPSISSELQSAELRTDDGCTVKSSNILGGNKKDIEELVETYSMVYRLDKDELLAQVNGNLKNHDVGNKDDETIVQESAEEMQDQEDKSYEKENINSLKENDEKLPGLGTPWGNPNVN